MKGKIFIGWCGTNSLAMSIKEKLQNEDYEGIVGGQSGKTETLFVGESVLKEIDQCNQAIFVIQKKCDGTISNNLMFEFGYSLSRFNANKIHVFYIDIEQNDPTIPSDLNGIWANFFVSNGTEDICEKIINTFLSNQKNIIVENKMDVINSYHSFKEKLQTYNHTPYCSEYELSQYILFFSQAAYMFENEVEAMSCIEKAMQKLSNPSEELEYAFRFADCYLDIFLSIKNSDDTIFLEHEDFKRIRRRFNSVLDKVETWKEDDFTLWLKMFSLEAKNYSYILYSFNKNIDSNKKIKILTDSIGIAEECLSVCDKLAEKKQNIQCLELYRAYMYRNLSTAYLNLEGGEEKSIDYLYRSYKARKNLVEYYEIHPINSKIYDTFEMEQFLALSELLNFIDDEDELEDYIDDCNFYLRKVQTLHKERSHFIDKIQMNIDATRK